MSESTTSQDSLDGRKASAEAQKELRRRCIVYFRKGVKRAEIARKLGLSRQWVTKTIQAYQCEGEDAAIQGKKRGLPEAAADKRRLLSRTEEKQGSSSKALSNFAPRVLLSITQAKFLCKRLFRVLLKSFPNSLDYL